MAFFYYALCVLCLHFTSVRCIEFQRNGIDSNFVVHEENSVQSLEHDEILSAPRCDCGPKSKNCKFSAKGEKVCECEKKYRQVDGFCERITFCDSEYLGCRNYAPCVNESCECLPGTRGDLCEIVEECEGEKGLLKCGDPEIDCRYDNETQKAFCSCRRYDYKFDESERKCVAFCDSLNPTCENGAPCVNESCECLPGTSGEFCSNVDECEEEKEAWKCGDPYKMYCRYDVVTQKAVCDCRTYDYLYDESRRECVECDCNKDNGNCSLVNGVKSCECKPGHKVKKEDIGFGVLSHYRCSPCDCGNNSNGCSFEDKSGGGISRTQVCDCKEGYYENQGWNSVTCEECPCEPHGTCYITWPGKVGCNCDDGYKVFLTKDRRSISCKECDCGGNGVCSFEQEVKKCQCDTSFAERDGKCVACQCYANDKTVDCYFDGRIQHCLCPEGYENGTFFCEDINECLNRPDGCHNIENTYCVNTIGSFECPCLPGYEPREEGGDPKIYDGCVDIDECEIKSLCPPVHTLCTNLQGTYTCECERGYEPVTPYETAVIAGCQPRRNKSVSSPWKTAVIIVGVIFGLCIAGLGIAILIKRRSAGQLPRMDTALQNMR